MFTDHESLLCDLGQDVLDQVVSEKKYDILVMLLLVVVLLLGFIHFAHILCVGFWSEQEAKQCISNVGNLDYITGILIIGYCFVLGSLVAFSLN